MVIVRQAHVGAYSGQAEHLLRLKSDSAKNSCKAFIKNANFQKRTKKKKKGKAMRKSSPALSLVFALLCVGFYVFVGGGCV